MATGITSAPHLQVLTAKSQQNMTRPMIFVRLAGDYQLAVNLVALLVLAIYPLSRLFTAATTVMARSAVALHTATGGPLLRAIATISTAWATTMVACIPSTTARATGCTYGVYGLASPPRPIPL